MQARSEAVRDAAGAIEVDFEGLARLVATVRGLAGELAVPGDLCGHMNDPDLYHAFRRVDGNWHKQRAALQTFWDSAAASVAASLAAYQQHETELEQASRSVR